MTEDEFRAWWAFHATTPIDDQSNHHVPVAYLQASLVNLNTPKEKPRVKLKDFLLWSRQPEQEPDIDDLLLGGKW
jgi:hypothetical protein